MSISKLQEYGMSVNPGSCILLDWKFPELSPLQQPTRYDNLEAREHGIESRWFFVCPGDELPADVDVILGAKPSCPLRLKILLPTAGFVLQRVNTCCAAFSRWSAGLAAGSAGLCILGVVVVVGLGMRPIIQYQIPKNRYRIARATQVSSRSFGSPGSPPTGST